MAQHVDEHVHVAELDGVDDVEAGRRDQTGELHFGVQVGAAGGGQDVEPDGEDELQDQAEEEHRGGVAQDGEGADAGIGGTVALAGGESAQADADDQRHDQGEEGQFECGGAVVRKDADHRLVIGQRRAEVAVQQAAKIVDVLHDQRAVIAGRVDALLEFGGCQAAAQGGGNRVAGGAHHEEHDGDQNENGGNNEKEPRQHEAEETT